jgi:molybdopterin synthase sulfur carrier subunit
MINILLFAQLREVLSCDNLTLESVPDTVGDLRRLLANKGELWAEWLASGKALSAVNQTMADDSVTLKHGDDIAFFPPVTGG